MKILLDHQLSPSRLGRLLHSHGHDVRAIASEEALLGLPDADVLALAGEDSRILVTCDAQDFVPIAREWAEAGRSHAGLVLVVSLENRDYAAIAKALERLFALNPRQRDWRELVLMV